LVSGLPWHRLTEQIAGRQSMNKETMERWWSGGALGTVIVLVTCAVVGLAAWVRSPALRSATASATPWYVSLGEAEADLAANDTTAALHHWREAYAAAAGSRRSDGLVEIGNFYRRVGVRTGLGQAANARARECYLTALLRARSEGSIDGVLAAGEAFLELGDADMVRRSVHIARELALRDVDPRARQRANMLDARAERAAASSVGYVE
jgi:hypothetical protein